MYGRYYPVYTVVMFITEVRSKSKSGNGSYTSILLRESFRVGSKVNPDWLRRWLQAPQGYDPKTRMSRYRYDEKQVALLSSFLLSKKDDDFAANVHLPESDAQSVARGKKLVSDYGCTACHRVNGINPPESFAPDLSRIGSKPLFQVG